MKKGLLIDENDLNVNSIISSKNNAATAAEVGGTANAVTITSANGNVFPLYSALLEIKFIAEAANTGAATINIDAQGAKAIVKNSDGAALTGGEIPSGSFIHLAYDGTSFRLIGS